MSTNSETILSQQTHIGDSSLQSLISNPFKGDGYYSRSDGLHTIQVSIAGFIGKISIQGTLAVNPVESDWFTVELGTGAMSVDTTGLLTEQNITSVEYTSPTTNSKSYNFIGNYVWVRARVFDWTDGTINTIKLNH
jgi:hypothetical protein